MPKKIIFPKEWLAIHPYVQLHPSDRYFIELANQLYALCRPDQPIWPLPDILLRRISLYAAAYLEDVISGLGLWQSFIRQHLNLYGSPLPFYSTDDNYTDDEINKADLCFLVWNTLQKHPGSPSPFVHPLAPMVLEIAQKFYALLDEAYETAPANEALEGYFNRWTDEKDARTKLHWLFGRTYLTAPSVEEYLPQLDTADYYRIPCGPLALFLYEWIELLSPEHGQTWKSFAPLYPASETLTETQKAKNRLTYERFIQGNQGHTLVYLDGYSELHRFLTQVLQWPDDPNHTLPQLKNCHDFVLKVHPEKGLLLAKDICACISDPLNPLYNAAKASQEAFRLLTVPTTCPPDLLSYLLDHDYLPDAQWPAETASQHPSTDARLQVQKAADFIARHTLLYYYRGD